MDVPDPSGGSRQTKARTSPSTDPNASSSYPPFNERQARPLVWIPPPPHSPASHSQPGSSTSYFSYPRSGPLGYPPLSGGRAASGSHVDMATMPFGSFPPSHGYMPTTVPGQSAPNSSFEDWSAIGELDGDEDIDSDDSTEAGRMPPRSTSTESADRKQRSPGAQPNPLVAKKKPRVTLARGGACVACRTRKLKCTGEKPCRSCRKAKVECRYEEIPRKKPRAVLLEERVVELEMLLLSKGETVPPSALTGSAFHYQNTGSNSGTRSSPGPSSGTTASRRMSDQTPPTVATAQTVGNQPVATSNSFFDDFLLSRTSNTSEIDIPPHSPLETALINTVLPHAPHLFIPVHPQRFQALLTLPVSDVRRPHPALLYIMFAEAVRILERETPLPRLPPHPSHLFSPSFPTPATPSAMDAKYALQHVRGTSMSLLERARVELDIGIRNVDRPIDLLRAAIVISRFLYTIGRFVEGWAIPIPRIAISCGLHRSTGNYYPPDDKPALDYIPPLAAPAEAYKTTYALLMGTPPLPTIRMRPVIVAPARDEIEVAERNLTFWFAKSLDWEAGIGWGWTTALADDECITEWPWGWGVPEHRPQHLSRFRWGVRDLYSPNSPMHSSPFADSTFTLAVKSIGLLHRAQSLHDVPESAIPVQNPDGRFVPSHIPPLATVQNVRSALQNFRKRIPTPFLDDAVISPTRPDAPEQYDNFSDPWWLMLHFNLYAAEMLMWKEMSHHHSGSYETAVGCARAVVGLVKRMRPENWIHLDMVVALDLSLSARFLYKESARLADRGQAQAAAMASEEADVLKLALVRDFTPWLPMANLHAMIVERCQAGWTEKEGEYERM